MPSMRPQGERPGASRPPGTALAGVGPKAPPPQLQEAAVRLPGHASPRHQAARESGLSRGVDRTLEESQDDPDNHAAAHLTASDPGAGFGTSLVDGEPVEDFWAQRPFRRCWKRVHAVPRRALFTPLRVQGGPREAWEVGDCRVTRGRFCTTGRAFIIIDDWGSSASPHRALAEEWVGATEFEPWAMAPQIAQSIGTSLSEACDTCLLWIDRLPAARCSQCDAPLCQVCHRREGGWCASCQDGNLREVFGRDTGTQNPNSPQGTLPGGSVSTSTQTDPPEPADLLALQEPPEPPTQVGKRRRFDLPGGSPCRSQRLEPRQNDLTPAVGTAHPGEADGAQTAQPATRVPGQPATSEPTGGSSWTYL